MLSPPNSRPVLAPEATSCSCPKLIPEPRKSSFAAPCWKPAIWSCPHTQQLARPRQVLEARDGRLRTQRGSLRQTAESELEGRVVAQAVGVVGVLVAGGDHQHPEAQDVGHAVDDTLWCARVIATLNPAIRTIEPTLAPA